MVFSPVLALAGRKPLSALSPRLKLRNTTNYNLPKGREGKTTADFALKVLSAVFSAAHKQGQSLINPCCGVERLDGEAEERDPFTDAQVSQLITG